MKLSEIINEAKSSSIIVAYAPYGFSPEDINSYPSDDAQAKKDYKALKKELDGSDSYAFKEKAADGTVIVGWADWKQDIEVGVFFVGTAASKEAAEKMIKDHQDGEGANAGDRSDYVLLDRENL